MKINEFQRSVAILAGACVATIVVTLGLAWMITGPGLVGVQPATGAPSAPTSGIGGALNISGDRTATVVLNREVIEDRYALHGANGRVVFTGQPATVARMQFEGLDFFLDPGDCAYTIGERDAEMGLAPVDVRCVAISDVRHTALINVDGTLRMPAEQFGLRGDLPQTGGDIALGDETLKFDSAAINLQRPGVIVDPATNLVTRFPLTYPVTLEGDDGTLRFVYDYPTSKLQFVGVELARGLAGTHGGACEPSLRELGKLSPRVTVAEMRLDCAGVALGDLGIVPLSGALLVDVIDFPQ